MQMNDDNGKIRVLVFELDGSNATLQESLRTIANAFGMGQTVMRPTLEQSPQVPPSIQPTASTEVVDVEAKNQERNFPSEETIRATSPRAKRKQKFQTPKILDIDLTSGALPFKTFCEMKANPKMDTKRYLLIAAWFKEHLNLEAITTDHVYTCYRFMG
jgi:hypothetical protein